MSVMVNYTIDDISGSWIRVSLLVKQPPGSLKLAACSLPPAPMQYTLCYCKLGISVRRS